MPFLQPRIRTAKKAGFTLIELMVVIAIIAILASITIPVIGRALESARRARANAEVRTIQNAVMNYFNEYGRFPHGNNPGGSDYRYGELTGANVANRQLMNVLRAIGSNQDEDGNNAEGNSDHAHNPRRIVFLEAPEYALNIGTTFNYLDPWENQYEIIVDTNFDGQLVFTGIPGGWSPVSNRRVGVWSNGNEPDKPDRHIYSW